MSVINKEISIPNDNDGFVLLRCPQCGEFFKLRPNELQAEDVINIWCPSCGLISESYLTMDIIELAMNMAKNMAFDTVFNEFKRMERSFKGSGFSFKANKKPNREAENPIVAGIEAMEIEKYKCCKREAKIKPLVKLCGSFCPYCGVRYDEFK
ncbi:TFIIB-type zinc ribbon-containing protein [Clostridium tertium]|uniref:TFIIB-type zinc ribbon-containing protein n=1 Tax=Clostridium tertium TaxID=1559 RepID=UPI00232B4247|nr:TFIIB-type zinc ribbon-containing protein [Clostridium tertium]MDB1940085.1 TFIIB-type zinc ribbon-containing protein [Clostridium tertium]